MGRTDLMLVAQITWFMVFVGGSGFSGTPTDGHFYERAELYGPQYVDRCNLVKWKLLGINESQRPSALDFGRALREWRETELPSFVRARNLVVACRTYVDAGMALDSFRQSSHSNSERSRAVGYYGLLYLYDRFVYQGSSIGPSELGKDRPYGATWAAFASRLTDVRLLARKYPALLLAYLECNRELYFMSSKWVDIVKELLNSQDKSLRLILAEAMLSKKDREYFQQAKEIASTAATDPRIRWRAKYLAGLAAAAQNRTDEADLELRPLLNDDSTPPLWREKVRKYFASRRVWDLELSPSDSRPRAVFNDLSFETGSPYRFQISRTVTVWPFPPL